MKDTWLVRIAICCYVRTPKSAQEIEINAAMPMYDGHLFPLRR